MPDRIPRLTSREVEQVLSRHGFELVSQRGSHRKWRHPDKRLQAIVPEHKGKTLPVGTLRSIFGNAQVPEGEWNA